MTTDRKQTSATITEKYKKFLYPGVITYYKEPLALTSGKGCKVFDDKGREYLDFFGGILTVSIGHCNEPVTNKIIEQLKTLQHVSTLYPTAPAGQLAERLAGITPGDLKCSFFTNSGTEADELAVLTAQHHTGATEIIALRHCYSGRSAMAMSMTAHSNWRITRNIVPGIRHAHAPYCYRCPFHLKYPSCDLACATDLEELIMTETSGKVAAFIAEPILGVGGFITPPPDYFKVAVEIVRKHGGLFIADEVQTGWGRTGKHWFGIEHYGVTPDIMTSAKGMANGIPIGWTTTTPQIAANLKGLTISTFGGNPVSMAAGLATIDFIDETKILKTCDENGAYLQGKLVELQKQYPCIGDVRGKGLMIGVEIVSDPVSKKPDPQTVVQLFEETRKQGLLIGKGGLYGNVIRIAPPMTITRSEIDHAVSVLKTAFAGLKKS